MKPSNTITIKSRPKGMKRYMCTVCGSKFDSYGGFKDSYDQVCGAHCGFISQNRKKNSLLNF